MTEHKNKSAAKRNTQNRLFGVVDIGSNSVRLVVYQGLRRNPQVLFNEKVLCGLGGRVGQTGRMDDAAVELAMATLRRFSMLCDDMRLDHIEVVATAAVRDSENGPGFTERVARECGFNVKVLSGKKEARFSALGVISGIPAAGGIVGDLGGGSLELVRIEDGTVLDRVTLPIGPVRLLGEGVAEPEKHRKTVKAHLQKVAWLSDMRNPVFYLVGGSWRAFARLHMAQMNIPLHVLQGYEFGSDNAQALCQRLITEDMTALESINVVSSQRRPALPIAAMILDEVIKQLQPLKIVPSSLGLREGIHYNKLNHAVRSQDPFLAACRDLADMTGRFPEHADKLMAWIAPVFDDRKKDERRLRYAACLLSDIGWRGHPEFRAERAIYEILYGRFVGVDHVGRAFVGLAIYLCYGGSLKGDLVGICQRILSAEQAREAGAVGLALRLGQRISGGTSYPLSHTRLRFDGSRLELHLQRKFRDLTGLVVEKRLAALASHLGVESAVVIDGKFKG